MPSYYECCEHCEHDDLIEGPHTTPCPEVGCQDGEPS
jgi:hypothetical protein